MVVSVIGQLTIEHWKKQSRKFLKDLLFYLIDLKSNSSSY